MNDANLPGQAPSVRMQSMFPGAMAPLNQLWEPIYANTPSELNVKKTFSASFAGFTAAFPFAQTADPNVFNNTAIGFNSSFSGHCCATSPELNRCPCFSGHIDRPSCT